jgi:hypothetical protein
MNTYNTGRVQIGLRYVAQAPYMDHDAIQCQLWLLRDGGEWSQPTWWRRWLVWFT